MAKFSPSEIIPINIVPWQSPPPPPYNGARRLKPSDQRPATAVYNTVHGSRLPTTLCIPLPTPRLRQSPTLQPSPSLCTRSSFKQSAEPRATGCHQGTFWIWCSLIVCPLVLSDMRVDGQRLPPAVILLLCLVGPPSLRAQCNPHSPGALRCCPTLRSGRCSCTCGDVVPVPGRGQPYPMRAVASAPSLDTVTRTMTPPLNKTWPGTSRYNLRCAPGLQIGAVSGGLI